MVEIIGVGIGFSLTVIYIFSLGFLYYVDYTARIKKPESRTFFISLGVLALVSLLVLLVFSGRFIIDTFFILEERKTAFRFLTVGIIFGIITFPFVLRASTRLFIKT